MESDKFNPQDFGPIWDKIMEEMKRVNAKYDVPMKIGIVGFGKAGKSTLFNAIFGKDIQAVGAQTDLTEDENDEKIFGTIFTDTRGFGTKRVSVEDIKPILHDQNIIIHCINGMTAISEDDNNLYNFCDAADKPTIVTITKADVMKERELSEYSESIKEKIDPSIEPIFISAETGLNMTLLINRIIELLPEAAQRAFIAKQRVDMEIKRKQCRKVIHSTAVAGAGVAVSPIPFADVAVLIPMQAGMAMAIGKIYGYEISIKRIKELFAVAGGGIVLRFAFQGLVKFLPIAGSIIGPIIAYGGTVALGESALAYFESGMKLTSEDIAEVYKRAKEKATEEFKDSDQESKIKAHEKEIKRLNDELKKGNISQEEYEKRLEDLIE